MVQETYVFKDFPHSSHRQLLDWAGPGPSRTLDVGTATGFLGRALAAAGHTVVGVEANGRMAQEAAPYYQRLYQEDITAIENFPEAPFDLIVLGDVLEHLPNPVGVLCHLREIMADGGRMLICVPNVAFIQVRVMLCLGRFEYQLRGILDETHLRFFTKRSFLGLLERAGLRVTRWMGIPPPLPLVFPWMKKYGFLLEPWAWLARTWPTLWAYQLLAEVRRRK